MWCARQLLAATAPMAETSGRLLHSCRPVHVVRPAAPAAAAPMAETPSRVPARVLGRLARVVRTVRQPARRSPNPALRRPAPAPEPPRLRPKSRKPPFSAFRPCPGGLSGVRRWQPGP